MHMGARYSMNSRNANVFCQARLIFWTTFADQETTVLSMGIWFTHTVIRLVSQPLCFGAFKLPSLPNCRPFENCTCLLHLSIQITTAAAVPSLSHNYPTLGGWFFSQSVHSLTMEIPLLVQQLSLWGFIWTPNPKLIHWCSAHHPQANHFHWQLLCGNHSIKRNMVCHLPDRTHCLTMAQCHLSTQRFHQHCYHLCSRAAFNRCIICICRASTPPSLMALLSFHMTAYAPVWWFIYYKHFHNDHTYVRPFSPFEFTSCFGFIDRLQYQLSQHGNWFALNAGIPALTSAWVFDYILDCLLSIYDWTTEVFELNQFAAPAATIQAFLSGAVGISLPSREHWIQAYDTDRELKRIRDIIANPPHYLMTHCATSTITIILHSGNCWLWWKMVF